MSNVSSNEYNFTPSLAELEQTARSTHLLVSGFLRTSVTFRVYAEAMAQLGIDGSFQPYELPRKGGKPDTAALAELLNLFRVHPELETMIVSDPYKHAVIELLDGLEPRARQANAVNLVFKRAFSLIGDNLDGEAFLMGAEAELKQDFRQRRMLFFGCGGVSSAVATKLAPMLSRVGLIDIIPEKAVNLRGQLQKLAPKLEVQVMERNGLLDLRDYEVFYNGTGLGKHSREPESESLTPLMPGDLLPAEGLAIDANYTPWQTAFLLHLGKQGFTTLNGFSHMVGSTTLHLAFMAGRTISYSTIKRFAEKVVGRG